MLYHYTQLRNLNKIFCENTVSFRMYDSRWMNDPSQSKVLQDYILQYKDAILREISSEYHDRLQMAIEMSSDFTPLKQLPNFIYVLSFSTISDSNIFWGSKYSGLNGFAISLDGEYFVQKNFEKIGFARLEDVYYFNAIEGEPNLQDIKHVARRLESIISELIKNTEIKNEIMPYAIWDSIIAFLSIFHKHPSWSHEREKRFAIITKARTNFLGVEDGFIKFFPIGIGEGGLNIYCDQARIDFDNNIFPRPYIQIEIPKNTAKQITLGPSFKDIDIESVRNYLYKSNYTINVLPSGAQIR